MLVHEFLLVNFTLTRNSQLNLDDRLNPGQRIFQVGKLSFKRIA